ncbi:unnamed protein product, partial [Scytosiphon promiscuus]
MHFRPAPWVEMAPVLPPYHSSRSQTRKQGHCLDEGNVQHVKPALDDCVSCSWCDLEKCSVCQACCRSFPSIVEGPPRETPSPLYRFLMEHLEFRLRSSRRPPLSTHNL